MQFLSKLVMVFHIFSNQESLTCSCQTKPSLHCYWWGWGVLGLTQISSTTDYSKTTVDLHVLLDIIIKLYFYLLIKTRLRTYFIAKNARETTFNSLNCLMWNIKPNICGEMLCWHYIQIDVTDWQNSPHWDRLFGGHTLQFAASRCNLQGVYM